jgi:REP element-mobilizing transposase RayT
MTRARNQLISLETTPYYHCISRCVRRAFLWGEDSLTGKNYTHRKAWVIARLRELADVFAIEICAYAVMANHYHLVLRVDRRLAEAWSQEEVIAQWKKLYRLPQLVHRYQRGETTRAEAAEAERLITTWRHRLTDISWFMRSLNEHLARRANEEDGCSGRFWEGRFKSQALLDEAAVLTCMSYVDLNPLRAGIADTPEQADFTSIQQRIRQYRRKNKPSVSSKAESQPIPLMPLAKQKADRHENAIGFTLTDYLALIDWAGRAIREDKRGAIPEQAPRILQRIGLEGDRYLEHLKGHAATEKPTMLGHMDRIRQAVESLGRTFIKGIGEAQRLYRTSQAM